MADRSVILLGCGRLGSSLVEGWLATDGLDPRRLIILTPSDKPATEAARAAGARINPDRAELAHADRIILGVKPAKWREASAPLIDALAPDALVVSMMAGVMSADLSAGFAGRPVARVMPTTSMAVGEGVASIWAERDQDVAAARALFAPVARVTILEREALIDPATAVSGSGQAYFFAFVQALAQAGAAQGLSPEQALELARGTLLSAAAAMRDGQTPQDLIARVASPGGTTQAALDELARDEALQALVSRAVDAAVVRAGELSKT